MNVNIKFYKDSVLCRLKYIEEDNTIYEGEIKESYAGKINCFNLSPDPRICGYGKLTYSNGKVVYGFFNKGKPIRYITIRPNGKRDFVAINHDDPTDYSHNQVYFTKNYEFIPGGHRKDNTNNWSNIVKNDIIEIDEIISLQQAFLKDKPIFDTKMPDGWISDTMVSHWIDYKQPYVEDGLEYKPIPKPEPKIVKINQSVTGNFQVELEKIGNQPLVTIQFLQKSLGISLSKAKAIVDNTPTIVISNIDQSQAIMLKELLELVENVVNIKEI